MAQKATVLKQQEPAFYLQALILPSMNFQVFFGLGFNTRFIYKGLNEALQPINSILILHGPRMPSGHIPGKTVLNRTQALCSWNTGFTWKNDNETKCSHSDWYLDTWLILWEWVKGACHFTETNWQYLSPMINSSFQVKNRILENLPPLPAWQLRNA